MISMQRFKQSFLRRLDGAPCLGLQQARHLCRKHPVFAAQFNRQNKCAVVINSGKGQESCGWL
jgi:hypothetical protein